MSKALRPEQKSKASGPLSQIQRDFIAVHLARGATPRVIRDTMNRLSKEARNDLRLNYRMPVFRANDGSRRTWADLSGTRQVSLPDVRRVYDAMRKSPGRFNEERKAALNYFRIVDERNRAIAPVSGLRYTPARQLHDLGFARRFGADREALSKIAEEDLIPTYLQTS